MADFLKAYAPVRQWEGGWCNVPGDAGGENYAGIARAFSLAGRAGPSSTRKKTIRPTARARRLFRAASLPSPASRIW